MEITNNSRYYTIPLVVGCRIAQIVFFDTDGTVDKGTYSDCGKYQNSTNLKEIMNSWTPDQCLPKLYLDRELGEINHSSSSSSSIDHLDSSSSSSSSSSASSSSSSSFSSASSSSSSSFSLSSSSSSSSLDFNSSDNEDKKTNLLIPPDSVSPMAAALHTHGTLDEEELLTTHKTLKTESLFQTSTTPTSLRDSPASTSTPVPTPTSENSR